MDFLLILPIIFILSFSISLVFNYRAIEAIFISLVSIIIIALVLTLIMKLSTVIILIFILICITFITSLIYSIIKKDFINRTKEYFNSPALIILLIITIVFTRVFLDAKPVGYDDMSFWTYAPKVILEYNGFFFPKGIGVYSQTFGLPIYYALVAKVVGFSYDTLLSAKWFLVWVCLLLPFSRHDFKKSIVTMIYSVIIYGIIINIFHSIVELYSDIVVYSLFAGIVAYYYINNNAKANIIILFFMLLMPHMKSSFGLISTIFVFVLCVFDRLFKNNGKLKKTDYTFISTSILIICTGFLYPRLLPRVATPANSYTPMTYLFDYKSINNGEVTNFYPTLLNVVKSPIGLVLCTIVIISIILFTINFCKKKRFNFIYIAIIIPSITYLAYRIYKEFDVVARKVIPIVINHFAAQEYINMNIITIIAITMVIGLALYLFYFNTRQKRYFIMLCLFFICFCLVISLLITINMSLRADFVTLQYIAGLNRYLGICVYLIVFLVPMYLLGKADTKITFNKHMVFYALVSLIIMTFFIQPFRQTVELYNNKVNNYTHYMKYFDKYEKLNESIEQLDEADSNICIIIDAQEYRKRPNYIYIILQYYTLLPRDRFVLLDMELDVDEQINNLEEYVVKNNITKIAYLGENVEYNKTFQSLFIDQNAILGNMIYTVDWDKGKLKLEIYNQ